MPIQQNGETLKATPSTEGQIPHMNVDRPSIAPPAVAYTKRYVYDASHNLLYEGWALSAGDPQAHQPVWCIAKYTIDASGDNTLAQWADGDTKFDNVWNQYASLTYK